MHRHMPKLFPFVKSHFKIGSKNVLFFWFGKIKVAAGIDFKK